MPRNGSCAWRRASPPGQASEDGAPRLFLEDGHKLVTPEVAPGVTVALDLPEFLLRFEAHARTPTPHPLHLDDKSSTEVEAWLLIEMLHRDFDRDAFSKALPYTLDHLMSGDEAKYEAEDLAPDFAALAALIATVARVLARDGAARLACWPRTMEIGCVASGARVGFDFDAGFFVQPTSGSRRVVVPLERLKSMTPDDVAAELAAAAR